MKAGSAGVIESARQPSGFPGGLSQFDVSGSSLAFRGDGWPVPPHPNPLPVGEGAPSVALWLIRRARLANSRAAVLPAPEPPRDGRDAFHRVPVIVGSQGRGGTRPYQVQGRKARIRSGNSLPKGEGRGEGEGRGSFRVSLMEQALPEARRGFEPLTASNLRLCRRSLTAGVLGRRSIAVADPLQ